jgi:hypothetical protein
MALNELLEILVAGKAPRNVRAAIARGLAPLPPKDALRAFVFLTTDPDPTIAADAKKTLEEYDEESILTQLRLEDCHPSVAEYFGNTSDSVKILQAVVTNSATPGAFIESLSLTLEPELLAIVLDNRTRVLEHPNILKNIKMNPLATQDIHRLVAEIETEFLGDKKTEYAVKQEQEQEQEPQPETTPDLEFEIPLDDLSLDGLPLDDKARDAVMGEKLIGLSFREKIRYALFGNRQVRSLLIRDSNREVTKMVLRSPKITEAEIESISAMRGVGEEILRDIGNSKEFTKSYNVVHNLIKNPKTPPIISQRLIFRLRSHDLTMLARDRGIPEIVRFHATRTLSQRSRKGS